MTDVSKPIEQVNVGLRSASISEALIPLAIDCMGGDAGLSITLPAAMHFLKRVPDARLILVGKQDEIAAWLRKHPSNEQARLTVVAASEVVTMDDPPAHALRRKKDSSMRVAINQVKAGHALAAVSAGNTGALMAISRFVLDTLEGIDRPAIATALPNQTGGATTMLDLGANVDCEPEHLLQFAIMGCALLSAVEHKDRPSVGLLNIGEEVIKGNEVVKRAAELLRASGLNFFGNVEGNDIYKGTTDLVVCDGFVGNVVLKASEGIAKMFSGAVSEQFKKNWMTKFLGLLAYPVLGKIRKRFDARRHNGACLLGLRGIVVKSHGSADAYAFGFALQRAYDMAKNNVQARIANSLKEIQALHLENLLTEKNDEKNENGELDGGSQSVPQNTPAAASSSGSSSSNNSAQESLQA